MRYDETPPWAQRQDTSWWSLYGRMVRWTACWAVVIFVPLIIGLFVDREAALEKLRILVFGGGSAAVFLLGAAWFYNRRDGATTLDALQDAEEARASAGRHTKA